MPKGLHVLPGIEFCSELGGSFRSCRGLLRRTFCNFVARNDSRSRLQHDVNAPNGIFPRKRSI